MKRFGFVITLAAFGFVGLIAGPALGQYYTPLRYDLRYTSPTYIPSGTMRFGPPARYDPYKFGHYNPGNLSITGNLRLGKSFRGTSPYRSTGSQLSMDLPSTRLSDFRRDTIGIGDIGTGLEYGRLGAFYPGSASVTTPYSAGARFAVPLPGPRAPYVPRNVNVPPLPTWTAPNTARTAGYSIPEYQPTTDAPMAAGGLAIPADVLNEAEALLDGRVSPLPDDVTEPPAPTDIGDLYQSPHEKLGRAFDAKPANIFIPDGDAGEHAGDMTMSDQPSALFWRESGAAGTQEPRTPEGQGASITATGIHAADTPRAEDAWPEPDGGDENGPAIPAAPPTPVPVSTYAVYVMRGHAAVKEGAYSKAEALYAAGVALEPDRPAAFFGRIHALLARRMYLQVVVVLERELGRHPQWVKVAPNLKSVYPNADVYKRIVAELEGEVAARPNDVGSNFLIGYVYYTAGEHARARPYLEKVARARDDKPGAEKAILAAISGG